ncbi:accessory factor UbiK family protein [Marinimicrobium alkaliphilum]|uniref:accessory factor UbiK family protein n=1 Tax=Marinimicrobium alkaliphilum TaxID=2202654 RepID=UPI000DB94420|nr:accessory factor UbiK family protein [Marinimicrobium alkaliphilum]
MNDFAQRFFQDLKAQLPQAAQLLPKKELQAALQSSLNRLDLVTREEFDAQSAVLQRTRQRLEALEVELAQLQAQLDRPAPENDK